jgi:hypothetical protein
MKRRIMIPRNRRNLDCPHVGVRVSGKFWDRGKGSDLYCFRRHRRERIDAKPAHRPEQMENAAEYSGALHVAK